MDYAKIGTVHIREKGPRKRDVLGARIGDLLSDALLYPANGNANCLFLLRNKLPYPVFGSRKASKIGRVRSYWSRYPGSPGADSVPSTTT